jgi:catechol 2,3-dioxygenase-like lactoylglutathione lyase family enzyme
VLESAEPAGFVPSVDLDRSDLFYGDVLGLPLVSRSPFADVYRCGGATLRVTKVDELRPQPFTVFGWRVTDLRAELADLRERGIEALVYDGLGQDDEQIWTTPGGDLVAWFRDPDGNVLSLTQFAST